MATSFLNGRIVDASRATVSVYDRGLLYGDGLFETMRAYRGVAFALEEHVARLRASAQVLNLHVPNHDWRVLCGELLQRNRLRRVDAWIRLVITRGAGQPGLLPPPRVRPTTIGMAGPVDRRPRSSTRAVLLPFARDGLLAEHKTLNYLAGVVGAGLAARDGGKEGLYVDGRELREGTTTSLFVVVGGTLCTPPARRILPGVTRRTVLDVAAAANIPTRERRVTVAMLRAADEAFLTSSVAEIVPLVRVDRQPIGNGHIGPITRQVQRLYRAAIERYCALARSD